jgi:hypothetical protein
MFEDHEPEIVEYNNETYLVFRQDPNMKGSKYLAVKLEVAPPALEVAYFKTKYEYEEDQ